MEERKEIVKSIKNGNTFLGIELGSTRIKAVLIGEDFNTIVDGSYTWENSLIDGIWTYALDEAWEGVQSCYGQIADKIKETYGMPLTTIGAIGISGMMHGYLVFDAKGSQLVPFRTWRNTITEKAAEELTQRFSFNVPQRWSIAHLYQAMLNNEEHINDISFLTTLSGYIHWKLTGEKVLGVGEASGVFPIDSEKIDYDQQMLSDFSQLADSYKTNWQIKDVLPKVLNAGENAGRLTEEGARMLDPTGTLQSGIPLCPPEGDAGTGMVATNSIAPHTGNVSAGTSVFAMLVLEHKLKNVHIEIDMVTTPDGHPVAMVHCNNFTSDLDAWVALFGEAVHAFNKDITTEQLYNAFYTSALKGELDGGGLLAYNYFAGEPITGFEEGRPLFVRLPDSKLNLSNFMRTHIFSALATLKIGMEILTDDEGVTVNQLQGHGGFFKTEEVGQKLMASALNVPLTVSETAGEGGAWGIALLAAYLKDSSNSLEDFLSGKVFARVTSTTEQPDKKDIKGFNQFLERYKKGLAIQRAAVDNLKKESD